MDYSDDDFYEDSIYDDFEKEQIELDPLDESDDQTVFDWFFFPFYISSINSFCDQPFST